MTHQVDISVVSKCAPESASRCSRPRWYVLRIRLTSFNSLSPPSGTNPPSSHRSSPRTPCRNIGPRRNEPTWHTVLAALFGRGCTSLTHVRQSQRSLSSMHSPYSSTALSLDRPPSDSGVARPGRIACGSTYVKRKDIGSQSRSPYGGIYRRGQ